MNEENRLRLSAFVRALEDSGRANVGSEAACHHSAVEVNDWKSIQAAMQKVSDFCIKTQSHK